MTRPLGRRQRLPGVPGGDAARDGRVHASLVVESGRLQRGGAERRGGQRRADRLGPPLVGHQRRVGVLRVGERGADGGAVLLGPAGRALGVAPGGGAEPLLLAVEERGVCAEVRGAGHEVLRGRVLLEAAHQVGDRGVVLVARHHRHVEPEAARLPHDDALQRHRHAREHLDVDGVGHPARLRQLPGRGEREHVVARDADVDAGRALGDEAAVERVKEGGVGGLLGVEHRQVPAVQFGLHPLHGEVRALDEADLDGRPALRHPRRGERVDPVEHKGRLAQVGLHRDARAQAEQVGLRQQALEHVEGQVQVAVLLHVEVDELAGAGGERKQGPQPLDGVVDGGRLAPGGVGAEHGGDLDGDVVDVVAAEQCHGRVEAPGGVLLAEHRLAEQVHVQVRAARGEPLQRGAERAADVDDQVADHRGEHAPHDGKQRERGAPDDLAQSDAQRRGQEVDSLRGQPAEGGGGNPGVLRAQHLVDEVEGEAQPALVAEHVGQQFRGAGLGVGAAFLGPAPCGGGGVVDCLAQWTDRHGGHGICEHAADLGGNR